MLAYLSGLLKTTGAINEIDAIQTEIEHIEAVLAIVKSARYTIIAQAPFGRIRGDHPETLGRPQPTARARARYLRDGRQGCVARRKGGGGLAFRNR